MDSVAGNGWCQQLKCVAACVQWNQSNAEYISYTHTKMGSNKTAAIESSSQYLMMMPKRETIPNMSVKETRKLMLQMHIIA